MPQAILNQILDQLQILEPFELEQLSQVIQSYLVDRERTAKRAAFHQALVAAGLVKQIKKPTVERRTRQPLIQTQDGSVAVSQTIVEQRH